eukprot:565322-Alexandrium_andersonii.AAC.1
MGPSDAQRTGGGVSERQILRKRFGPPGTPKSAPCAWGLGPYGGPAIFGDLGADVSLNIAWE